MFMHLNRYVKLCEWHWVRILVGPSWTNLKQIKSFRIPAFLSFERMVRTQCTTGLTGVRILKRQINKSKSTQLFPKTDNFALFVYIVNAKLFSNQPSALQCGTLYATPSWKTNFPFAPLGSGWFSWFYKVHNGGWHCRFVILPIHQCPFIRSSWKNVVVSRYIHVIKLAWDLREAHM